MATTTRQLLFRRQEIKYWVDRTTRTALTRDLLAFMRPDEHSADTDGYYVRSLYFDTADYMAYHEKLSGAAIRHKLRIRAYGADPASTPLVRLEVKSRYLAFIEKIAVDVSRDAYAEIACAIAAHRRPPAHVFENENISKEFFRIMLQYNMMPKILIRYRRQAFERRELGRIRVNFDDELYAARRSELFAPLRGGRRLLQYGHAVFEIKVDATMPTWLHLLIGKYNLQNQAISKFCYGVRSEASFSSVSRPVHLLSQHRG